MNATLQPKNLTSKRVRRLLGAAEDDELPTVALLAHVTDLATQEALLEIGFKTETGPWKSIRVPKEIVLHHPSTFRDLLTRYDAVLPQEPIESTKLMRRLTTSVPPNWWRVAPALGWHVDGIAFVLHDRVLGVARDGKSRKAPKLVPPVGSGRDCVAALQTAGELAAWKKQVASSAKWSSATALALSTAFAAPLLAIVDWPTFMVVLYGRSKIGKSTAALVGATVLGIGHEKDLPNWNLTAAAMPELACCYNDLALVLNSLESTKLSDKELREFLKATTYILGDGTETRRHSSWAAAKGKLAPATWRTIALVTTEHSFDEIASRARDTRMDGERARAINVPAVATDGNTIIDWFPNDGPKDPAERVVWARQKVEALRAACASHHGVALGPYLRHVLAQDRSKLVRAIRDAQAQFTAAVAEMLTTEALNHAAKNFGILYAGGLLAIEAGLLSLSGEQLLRRLVRCFKRGMRPVAPDFDVLPRALKLLDDGLRRAIAGAKKPPLDTLIAMSESASGGAREFVVHSTKLFGTWFGADEQARIAALRWLCEQGLLDVADRAGAARAGFTIASVRHTRRIQGKNCAAIVLRDPRPALAKALEKY